MSYASSLGPVVPATPLGGASLKPGLKLAKLASTLTMLRPSVDASRGPDYASCLKAYPEKPLSYCRDIYPPLDETGSPAQKGTAQATPAKSAGMSTGAKVAVGVAAFGLLAAGVVFFRKRGER